MRLSKQRWRAHYQLAPAPSTVWQTRRKWNGINCLTHIRKQACKGLRYGFNSSMRRWNNLSLTLLCQKGWTVSSFSWKARWGQDHHRQSVFPFFTVSGLYFFSYICFLMFLPQICDTAAVKSFDVNISHPMFRGPPAVYSLQSQCVKALYVSQNLCRLRISNRGVPFQIFSQINE